MTKKLHIKTYGCQMNVYDSVRMQDVMAPMGYQLSDTYEDADLVVLNTCHIREKAEEKVYSELGRIRKEKEEKKQRGEQMLIAVAGCVAQAEGEEIIKRAPYVDMVLGTQSYHLLPEMVTKALRKEGKVIELDFPTVQKFDLLPEATSSQGVSAFIAVQEGCDKFCTFCVVPYTRGAEYSRPMEAIVKEARALVDQGAIEIMLLGQNVNAYHGGGSLANLITKLSQINGLERIRYTTSHPRDMSDDLIAIHGSEPKVMPYLHLPIQSGSDAILKKMNRKHDAAFYMDIMERLRKARPDIALSSDFIIGFPGETDQDFENTMNVVRAVGFASAFSFKYSPRPGTPAATDEKQIDEAVKDERLARLQALIARQQLEFNQSVVGRILPVLFDRDGKFEGQLVGKTPYLQSVYLEGAEHLRGQIADVKITGGYANSLTGEIVEQPTLRRAC
jgi:tRNA-2-methylthio-N6-dimethylallyladenosine synthase